MNSDLLPWLLFGLFLFLHFFVSQRLYNSPRFFQLAVLLFFLYAALGPHLFSAFPNQKFYKLSFLLGYHLMVLQAIRVSYRRLNNALIMRRWLPAKCAGKEVTFITLSEYGDVWDKKGSQRPSNLDRVFSFVLFFGPIGLLILTADL